MFRRAYPSTIAVLAACGRIGFAPAEDARTDDAIETDGAPLGPCPAASPATLSLYEFDSGPEDSTGASDAQIVGNVPLVPGPMACGNAISFDGDLANYVYIPDSPRWELTSGSVSFWLRVRSNGPLQGVVTRDIDDTLSSGHLGLYVDGSGRFAFRIQSTIEESLVCSNAPIPLGTWTHIHARFGPPRTELVIDGVLQAGTGMLASISRPCDAGLPIGIDGNDAVWGIGVNTGRSDGALNGIELPFDGELDHLRISSSRD